MTEQEEKLTSGRKYLEEKVNLGANIVLCN
jgi:hypothetical protein